MKQRYFRWFPMPDACFRRGVECGTDVVHIARVQRQEIWKAAMDELNGRMIAVRSDHGTDCARRQRFARSLRFLTDFRDEIRAVVKGVNIAGMDNTDRVRQIAQRPSMSCSR